jgi:type I restriction-modification system DNA methylase subunit
MATLKHKTEILTKSKERVKQKGEVFTPKKIVDQMLDQLPPEAWTNPSKTFLEPSCGTGNFLIAIHDRLMVGLEGCIPDPVERHRHIVEHMIYAVDIQADNVEESIDRINARGLNHHIVCADALLYDYSFGEDEPDKLFEF